MSANPIITLDVTPLRLPEEICLVGPLDFYALDTREQHSVVLVAHLDQRWQVSKATATLLKCLQSGERDLERLALNVSDAVGRQTTSERVWAQIVGTLSSIGLVNGYSDKATTRSPSYVDSLYFRCTLVGEKRFRTLSSHLAPLFSLHGCVLSCLAVVLVSAGLLVQSGNSGFSVLFQPTFILIPGAWLLYLCGTFAHEIGHAAAARHFAARHGSLGFGLYFAFPVLYMELHDTWRLRRWQRAVVDAGGLYFQLLFAVGLVCLGSVIPQLWPSAAGAVLITIVAVVWQLNPLVRFDGYWLLSDIIGIPNLRKRGFEALRWVIESRILGRKVPSVVAPQASRAFVAVLSVYGALCAGFVLMYVVFLVRMLPDWLGAVTPRLVVSWELTFEALLAGDFLRALAVSLQFLCFILLVVGGLLAIVRLSRSSASAFWRAWLLRRSR